ncbi:hypothetical protein [Dehalobacterium formicoaceticum]|uniref:Uncharacterized protein n=1 Tax=Dehalobacterium formicoaceticum TaxID=51515 RepID=A0ABT1Y550_9FIRM|nr:hypothetical protein [Dehalobacterium formicoaceticum]MCR6545275.1 hypothetical protein [Dehalobacterium formicoaceticum]
MENSVILVVLAKLSEYTVAAEPRFRCGGSHLSGMKSQPAFMPRKPLDNEFRHVRLMRQASTMLAWGMPLMPENMPVEARCQEDRGINAATGFLIPE